MKKIINIILVLVIASSWYFIVNNEKNIEKKAKYFENKADEFYKQELYSDSLDNYQKSLTIKSDINIKKKLLENYLQLENYNKSLEMLKDNSFEEKYIEDIQEKILEDLVKKEKYKEFNKIKKNVDEKVRKKVEEKYFTKYIYLDKLYDDVIYIPTEKNIFVKTIDKWQVINSNARKLTDKYEKIFGESGGMFTVTEKGKTFVIDNKENKRSVDFDEAVGHISDDLIVTVNGNKYSYRNRLGEKIAGDYEKASNFNNSKALILTDCVKLIDSNLEIIEQFDAKDFKVDDRNNAISDNKIIIKLDKGYYIYDIENMKKSNIYDDICFSYGEEIAVKKKDKWGYINQKFEEVIPFIYDSAVSFSQNIAYVKLAEKEVLINNRGKELHEIEGYMLSFNSDGVSFIKGDEGWKMIKLMRYIND